MKEKISLEELSSMVNQLSLQDLRKLNTSYLKNNKTRHKAIDKRITELTLSINQKKLIEAGLVDSCPKCGEKTIIRFGTKNGVQRFRCTECGSIFNPYTNTFMSKTRFSYDLWIEMVYMLLNHEPLQQIKQHFEDECYCLGIDIKTLFTWRQKIMDASKGIPLPFLKGTVQIDETFFFNVQKGSRSLVNPLNEKESRKPRKRAEASQLGCLSPEFANVLCAVDDTDHVIAKVISMGYMPEKTFNEEVFPYITNATWLCTDANPTYSSIAQTLMIEHYVRPSDYTAKLKKIEKENLDYKKLYNNGELDYIERFGKYVPSHEEMKRLKKKHGLSLSKVNNFHSILERNLTVFTKGVSTNHLDSYIAWEVMIHNYRIEHDIQGKFSKKQAEEILIMLLKTHRKLTVNDIHNKKVKFTFDRKYLNKLTERTEDIRCLEDGFDFKATPEEFGDNFNKREFLSNLKIRHLKEIAAELKIKNYSTIRSGHTWFAIKAIEVHPDATTAINNYIARHANKNNPEKRK